MKNTILAITGIYLSTVFLVSCTKENSYTKPSSGNESEILMSVASYSPRTSQQYEDLFDSIVKCGALGMIQVMQVKAYREIIKTEVSKAFDGDDNALFKDISASFTANGLNLQNLMQTSVQGSSNPEYSYLINQVLNGFPYFDKTYYSQILIPNIENYDINQTHAVAINTDDNDLLPGYKVISGLTTSISINEQYATENPVYVVMVNERVDNEGNPTKQFIGNNDNITNTNEKKLNRRGNKTLLELLITGVKVTTKKEKWGKGDVSYVAAKYGLPGDVCGDPLKVEMLINRFSTSEMSVWKGPRTGFVPAIFYPPTNNNDAWTSLRTCYVILYELDNRQKWFKEKSPSYCSNIKLTFISKQDMYGDCNPNRNDYLGVPQQSGATKIYLFPQAELKLSSDWYPED
ncbi:MAG: hypothetical protein RLZ10_1016 [Bacteroidota bacterium]|jgi:hypothetical protein